MNNISSPLGTFILPDDSGILAVVDSSRYKAFVHEYWTLEQLLDRFRTSMADRAMLVWSPGEEGNWRVSAELGPPSRAGLRSMEGTIQVSGSGLHLVSYDSLTMAAQFSDETIPQPHEVTNFVKLAPGLYRCSVTHLHSEYQGEGNSEVDNPHCILSFQPSDDLLPPWYTVAWLAL